MTETAVVLTPRVSPLRRWVLPYLHEIVLALLLVSVLVFAGWSEPRFLFVSSQLALAGKAWPLVLLALPMTMIVLTGGIDLSIGAATALCVVILGLCVEAGLPPSVSILLALLTGLLAGAVNGAMVALLRVHPLIVTLATLAAFRGIALAVTKGRTIEGFPASFKQIAAGELAGVPYPLIALVIAAVAIGAFLSLTSYGRFVYAIGHNARASRYAGVPVRAIQFSLYTFAGLCAGLAAVLLTSRYGKAKADFATGLELEVITAVVLGGVSIFGGRGHVVGVLLGVMLIHECQEFLQWHWHKSELNALVIGALLIGSVLINSLSSPRRR